MCCVFFRFQTVAFCISLVTLRSSDIPLKGRCTRCLRCFKSCRILHHRKSANQPSFFSFTFFIASMYVLTLSDILPEGIQSKIRVPKHLPRNQDILPLCNSAGLMIAMKTSMTAKVQFMIASAQPVWYVDVIVFLFLFIQWFIFNDMVLSSTFPFVLFSAWCTLWQEKQPGH